MKQVIIGLLVFLTTSVAISQNNNRISREDYIAMYKDIAIEKMHEYGIPASITLAQGILESESGNSYLAKEANNHFGIKCHSDWKGKSVRYDDDEANECFRKYKNAEESFKDHSLFLTQRSRYASLFNLEVTDYKAWAHGLKKAGYATNPRYAHLLIKLIDDYQLYQYDTGIPATPVNKIPGLFAEGYKFPSPDDFILITTLSSGRKVYSNNNVEFVFVESGDTFLRLSLEVGVPLGKLQKYNDLVNSDKLFVGQMLYLEKKKRRSKIKIHRATALDTPYSIAMLYGVRLKSVLWKNRMKKDDGFREGQSVYLKRRKPLEK